MCCFNRPIDHVWATRIFVGAKNNKQITIYAASILGQVIEMVLPVRTRGAKEIEFVDLKAFPDFFQKCEAAIQFTGAYSSTASLKTGLATPHYLEVHQVGDFKASFAPNWMDLDRADPRVFKLSKRLKDVLTAHYSPSEFGFVVYKPDHGGAMHPFAYRHSLASGDHFFVPTRHEHGHDGPPDWDHEIYHQGDASHIEAESHVSGSQPAGKVFQTLVSEQKPVPVELDMGRPLSKFDRKGRFQNEDLLVKPAKSSLFAAGVVGGAIAAGAGAYYIAKGRGARKTDIDASDHSTD